MNIPEIVSILENAMNKHEDVFILSNETGRQITEYLRDYQDIGTVHWMEDGIKQSKRVTR